MKKYRLILLIAILSFSFAYASDVVLEQFDWMGGEGVFGPVFSWGTQYAEKESVTTSSFGSVSLIATQWNYGNWIKHVVDTGISLPFYKYYIGFRAQDIDMDGDLDLIAYTDRPIWYEKIGYFSYIPHNIDVVRDTPLVTLISCADLDGDNDIDVVLCKAENHSEGELIWFEQDAGSWLKHTLRSTSTISFAIGDVDEDGDQDIVVFSWGETSEIILFRNDGLGNFFTETISRSASYTWRTHLADMDGDGDLDIIKCCKNLEVYLNDGDGNFSRVFSGYSSDSLYVDGTYPEDIDHDGDLDLVVGITSSGGPFPNIGFGAFINDGTGSHFDILPLWEESFLSNEDGAMASDIDLDGHTDIVGSFQNVSYLRQSPTEPLEFSLVVLDNSPGSHTNYQFSHWIHIEDIDTNCTPDLDIMTTFENEHIIYENAMLQSFASKGELISSIITIDTDHWWKSIGWEACIPFNNSIEFYWRTGNNLTTLYSQPWQGPYFGIAGVSTDTREISGFGKYFQYRVVFNSGNDVATLHRFWAVYDSLMDMSPIIRLIGGIGNCVDSAFTLRFLLENPGFGIDYSSVVIRINGENYSNYRLRADTVVMTYDDSLEAGDSLRICVSASDLNPYGPPNSSYLCYTVHACLLKCSERPNPFTPNGDGINDFVQFTFPEIGIKNADIFIYNLVGPITKIYVSKGISASTQARWYGTDDKGLAMPPGIYLYIIEIDEQIVCSGSLTLAR